MLGSSELIDNREMSKTMSLLSADITESATKYLKFFECDLVDGVPSVCKLSELGDLQNYTNISNFLNGSQAFPEMVFVILEHFAGEMPEDSFERLRWSTREIQQKVSLMFYGEDELRFWGISEGEKWVDRSLRVANDPLFNGKMFDSSGNLRLKNVFVHANHQYIYNCTLDVLLFLNNNP